MNEVDSPTSSRSIRSYHAHVYFRNAEERAYALRLRAQIGERFRVQLGRIHDQPIGPHSVAMYQVAFECGSFNTFVPFLMLNRQGLSVLVHPNTGHGRDDHLLHALWLGEPLAIRAEVLSNHPDDDPISPIEPNTSPHLAMPDAAAKV